MAPTYICTLTSSFSSQIFLNKPYLTTLSLLPIPASSFRLSVSAVATQDLKTTNLTKYVKSKLLALSQTNSSIKGLDKFSQSCLAFQVTALVTTIVEPAYAVTGVNYELDWVSIIIEYAVCAFLYFLVAPPIIMNWLRVRWFKRNVYEMYLQFMFVFLFFPGVLLWAPFLNFRKFPRDPSMKYPWSVPEDPSKIRNDYRKAPWATLEDYEV